MEIISRRDLGRNDLRMLTQTRELDSIEPPISSDPGNCPYVDKCYGAKDAEGKTRCLGGDFKYESCELYHMINDNGGL